jgi:hypothetical protein
VAALSRWRMPAHVDDSRTRIESLKLGIESRVAEKAYMAIRMASSIKSQAGYRILNRRDVIFL